MRVFRTKLFPVFCGVLLFGVTRAQDGGSAVAGTPENQGQGQQEEWPKSITEDDGTVLKIYQPQPEAFSDNTLKARWAISVLQNGKTDPTFGTFWTVANVETDRDNRRVMIQSVKVPNIKFPGEADENMNNVLKSELEAQLPQTAGALSLDDLLSSLDMNQEQKKLSKDLNTAAPRILFNTRPSLLVMIDGEPRLQMNKEWNLNAVSNSPFTIVKNNDGMFYLYGGKHWYSAQAATGPYAPAGGIPQNLQKVQQAVDDANSSNAGYVDSSAANQDNAVSDVIVSTTPAELIQSDGPPTMTPVTGTNLSYVSNSPNDIFQDQGSQQYYVLISGRWYTSPSLKGHWQYVAANALPADFARIPEGSPKDNVLSSVAGTDAAREAVMDAQIPQTAKVDRNTATTNVTYNGDPQFAPLKGTDMQYATNTSSSVLLSNGVYYAVDNGVWFQAQSPNGPWVVCTQRPEEVDRIPPSSPLYNVKYVDIYDVTPDYAYMGYTSGYLNSYIYGPTVVYGTGFYYDPWFGGYYYPRPWTWGFNMGYNPWCGWSLGYGYGGGWLNFGVGLGFGFGYGWGGGWWGPGIYRPSFGWNRYRTYGFYGNSYGRNRSVYANSYRTNIYSNRRGVATNRFVNNRSPFSNRPGGNAGGVNRPNGVGGRPNAVGPNRGNNVFSDRNGNVFQRNQQTNQWQQRQSNQWRPVTNSNQAQNLNRDQQLRARGQTRTQNFQQARSNAAPAPRPSGGGGGGSPRPSSSGGGGGGRSSGGRR